MVRRMVFILMLMMSGVVFGEPKIADAYNYGDYRSVTLITKAWKALQDKDLEAVLAYTNKCI